MCQRKDENIPHKDTITSLPYTYLSKKYIYETEFLVKEKPNIPQHITILDVITNAITKNSWKISLKTRAEICLIIS